MQTDRVEMIKSIIYLIFLSIIIGLTGCSQGSINHNPNEQTENAVLFLGEWESVTRIIPYSAKLTINTDNTFDFNYGACMARGFSSGQWTLTDNILTLNSFPADTCLFLRAFGDDCILVSQLKDFRPKTTNEDCTPENPDEYILFQEVKLLLIGDTLKHIFTDEKICPEARNDFFRP